MYTIIESAGVTRYSFISVHNSTEHGLTTYPVRIRWRDSCCPSTERHAVAGVGAEVAVHNEDFATTRPRDAIVPCSLDPDPFWLRLWLHAIHTSTRRTTRSGSPRSYHVVMRRVRLFRERRPRRLVRKLLVRPVRLHLESVPSQCLGQDKCVHAWAHCMRVSWTCTVGRVDREVSASPEQPRRTKFKPSVEASPGAASRITALQPRAPAAA
jgi:hypothetical protein